MGRQHQRRRFRNEQPVAHLGTGGLDLLDLAQQGRQRQHHAIANQAGHTRSHDAAGDQVQSGLDPVDHQGVTGIVAALKAHHGLHAIGEQVHDLPFAFIAPLRADHHH